MVAESRLKSVVPRVDPKEVRRRMGLFTIHFVSNLNFEHLTVEISYLGQLLCRIDKERGEDLDIEFFFDFRILKDEVKLKFPLSEFLKTVAEASEALQAT